MTPLSHSVTRCKQLPDVPGTKSLSFLAEALLTMSRVQSATQHCFHLLANQPDSFPGKQRQNEAAQEEDCIHINGSLHKKRQLILRCLKVGLTSSGQDMLNPICTRQLYLCSFDGAVMIKSHTVICCT